MFIELNDLDIEQIARDFNIAQKHIISSIIEYNKIFKSRTGLMNLSEQETIQNIIQASKIEYVLHFTKIENLASILENGIQTRQELENNNEHALFNDAQRIDGHRDATCCSISHPNYKMFYSYRQANLEQEWVVIGIKKNIIWKKDCAFCVENAASNSVRFISISQRKGIDAFSKLFQEIDGKPPRQDLCIPDSCPTNPQAEILVFDTILPEDILGVAFQSQKRKEEYTNIYKDRFQFIYHKAFFMPRQDWRHWQ